MALLVMYCKMYGIPAIIKNITKMPANKGRFILYNDDNEITANAFPTKYKEIENSNGPLIMRIITLIPS
ncbi:hypothetical protein Lmede01_11870 [Leuconostoc mesenteroides subsp. dextranicum]|nr:hypothetical protein Lmede01_11870 [Leuconostoc mesenteroides subsp. dextranicum]